MPTSTIKTKNGNSYDVKFRVVGTLTSLNTEQLQALALRYIRNVARATVVAELNAAEPEIVTNRRMAEGMVEKLGVDSTLVAQFFAEQKRPLEIPTEFNIQLADLVPDGNSGRGKKAADIFSFDEVDSDDEDEVVVPTVAGE